MKSGRVFKSLCKGMFISPEVRILVKVFVFINTEPGKEKEILQRLREAEGVREVYMVYGVYDIVAVVEADTVESVKEVILASIRRIEGVRTTMSMIVIEGKG
jgi:DNA-binding Lrp family transcriptional regulator